MALTRAKEQLFIISNKKPSSKGLKEDTIPYLFMEYIEQNDQFLNKSGYYYWGDPKRISTASKPSLKEPLLYTSFDKRENRIHVVQQNLERQQTQAAKRYGILIHDIWAKIRTIKDFEEVLNFYKKDIDHKLFEKLKNTLHTIINDRRLSECFSDKNTIYVERDFSYHGQLLRPDRVEITPDKKIYIIDYKTGAHDLSHIAQIEEYASLFQDYEEHQIIKKLVYINEEQYDIIEV